MRLVLTSTFVSALLALLVFGPPAFDAFHDRQHRIVVTGPLTIYQTPDEHLRDRNNSEVARVTDKDTLKVIRIRYEKDYMVVRVRLADGRQGYIFSGANFHIFPPADRR